MRSDSPRTRPHPVPAPSGVRVGATLLALLMISAVAVLAASCASTPAPEPETTADNNAPPPPPPPPPRRLVLSVGIDHYADSEIPANLTAVEDAARVAEALQRADDGESAEVVTLADEQATVEGITGAIRDIAAQTAERFEDTIVVYIATHGAAVKLPSGPWSPVSATKAFLVAHDTQRANILETGLGMDAFQPLWDCDAEHVIVILDAAIAGSARSVTGRTIDTGHVQHILDEQLEAIGNDAHPARALVFGADINEPIRIDPTGRSSFAVNLLEGINGAGDKNGDGDVQVAELVGYLYDRVENPDDSPEATPLSPIRVVADKSAGVVVIADCDPAGG